MVMSWFPGDVNILTLYGKGKLRMQMELRLQISWVWDGEIIPDYLCGPHAIESILKNGRGRSAQGDRERSQPDTDGFEDGRGMSPQNAGSLWKLEKAKEWILPWSLQKEHSLANIFILA